MRLGLLLCWLLASVGAISAGESSASKDWVAGVKKEIETDAATARDQPYDLRGIRLGATLQDVRKAPSLSPAAKLICAGDKVTPQPMELRYQGEEDRIAGVVPCLYFKKYTSSVGRDFDNWSPAGVRIATADIWSPTFRFLPDEVGALRLYAIEVEIPIRVWDTIWEGYTGRYGKPTLLDTAPASNAMGATFDNVTATWARSDSSILLVKRFATINMGIALYTHTKLSELVAQRKVKVKGRPKDNL